MSQLSHGGTSMHGGNSMSQQGHGHTNGNGGLDPSGPPPNPFKMAMIANLDDDDDDDEEVKPMNHHADLRAVQGPLHGGMQHSGMRAEPSPQQVAAAAGAWSLPGGRNGPPSSYSLGDLPSLQLGPSMFGPGAPLHDTAQAQSTHHEADQQGHHPGGSSYGNDSVGSGALPLPAGGLPSLSMVDSKVLLGEGLLPEGMETSLTHGMSYGALHHATFVGPACHQLLVSSACVQNHCGRCWEQHAGAAASAIQNQACT